MNTYYQILIETAEKTKIGDHKQYLELDKTDLDQIKINVIQPYLQGEEFQFNGYFLKKEKIIRLLIKTTEKNIQEICDDLTDKLPGNVMAFILPQHILSYPPYEKYTIDITSSLINEVKANFSTSSSKKLNDIQNVDLKRVFIVHGRDNDAKSQVARFIERLGFSAIILHEQASSGKTIIEKIEAHADVGFAIILYTPCDEGGLKDDVKKSRARQNVVFEHGYFVGKLTRQRVCALVKGDIEIPNDIKGIVYIPLDDHQAWHTEVAKELRQVGYDIDMNKI